MVDAVSSNLVSKLTVKTMGLNGKEGAVLSKEGDVVMLGTIYGRASETREKKRTDDSGNLVIDHPIVGSFEGVNQKTGEVFGSSVLYLPGGFHEQLEAALKSAEGGVVEFAIQIGSQRANNKAGFTWIAKSLVKPSGVDQLAELRSKIADGQKAIAAPVKTK